MKTSLDFQYIDDLLHMSAGFTETTTTQHQHTLFEKLESVVLPFKCYIFLICFNLSDLHNMRRSTEHKNVSLFHLVRSLELEELKQHGATGCGVFFA